MPKALLLILVFTLGFLVHAFFFPDFLYNGLRQALNIYNPQSAKLLGVQTEKNTQPQYQFMTYVNYNNGRFDPASVTIKRSYYLAITNMSKKEQMWLVSDHPLLNTKRGYAESERLQTILYEVGSYKVSNKLSPGPLLNVIVVP